MSTGSSDNSEKLTSFNKTNTSLRYELPIFDKKIEVEFDGFVLIDVDCSRDDASAQNPYIIRNDSSTQNT